MVKVNSDYLGRGIYSLSDASFLTKIHPTKIGRWVKGYKWKDKFSRPLITSDYKPIDDYFSISFLDLIELFFIDAFMKHGVNLKTIRKAYQRAIRHAGVEHPFSTKKFKTDGKIILAQVNDETLLNIINDQFAIKKILDPFLFDAFDFEDDVVNRLWPMGKNRQIVIDPSRSFGKPIVNNEGVQVEVLFRAYNTEKSINEVAKWFDVSNESVRDAVDYYQNLAA